MQKEIENISLKLKNPFFVSEKFPLISNLTLFENIELSTEFNSNKSTQTIYEELEIVTKQFNLEKKINLRSSALTPLENFLFRLIRATMIEHCEIIIETPILQTEGTLTIKQFFYYLKLLDKNIKSCHIIDYESVEERYSKISI